MTLSLPLAASLKLLSSDVLHYSIGDQVSVPPHGEIGDKVRKKRDTRMSNGASTVVYCRPQGESLLDRLVFSQLLADKSGANVVRRTWVHHFN